jgi:hypothetical protein
MENERASKLLEEASTFAMYKLVVFQKASDLLRKNGQSADIQSLRKIVEDTLNIDLLRHLLMIPEESQQAETEKFVEHVVQQYLKPS